MAVRLNHTIAAARDKKATAEFLTEILGLPGNHHSPPYGSGGRAAEQPRPLVAQKLQPSDGEDLSDQRGKSGGGRLAGAEPTGSTVAASKRQRPLNHDQLPTVIIQEKRHAK